MSLLVLLLLSVAMFRLSALQAARSQMVPPLPDVSAFRPHVGARISHVDVSGGEVVVHIDRPNAPVSLRLAGIHPASGDLDAVAGGTVQSVVPQPGRVRLLLTPASGGQPVVLVGDSLRYGG